MSALPNSSVRTFISILLAFLSLLSTTVAQTSSTSTPTSTSSYNVFSEIATSIPQGSNPGDNTYGSPNDNPDAPNPDTAGASGDSETAISLSSGDIIAIAVVVSVVVVLGLGSAILFYLTKKRQWAVRANLRRSARRLTSAVRARTPLKPNFSKSDREGRPRMESSAKDQNTTSKNTRSNRNAGGIWKDGTTEKPPPTRRSNNDADVEKGFGRPGFRTPTKTGTLPKPSPLSKTAAPKTSFELDSPLKRNLAEDGNQDKKENPGWMKFLGRK